MQTVTAASAKTATGPRTVTVSTNPLSVCTYATNGSLSGCSGAATTAAPSTKPSGPRECGAAGIDSAQLNEGTCISNGQTIVVVNKASTLHLKTLDANLLGSSTHNSLSSGGGQSAVANGKFVSFTITVKNKLDSPQQWQNGQALLSIPTSATHSAVYTENFTAENGPDQN
jgi:hypothetical protein